MCLAHPIDEAEFRSDQPAGAVLEEALCDCILPS